MEHSSLIQGEELCERAAHEVDDGPRTGARELTVLDVGKVHRLHGAFIHRRLCPGRQSPVPCIAKYSDSYSDAPGNETNITKLGGENEKLVVVFVGTYCIKS